MSVSSASGWYPLNTSFATASSDYYSTSSGWSVSKPQRKKKVKKEKTIFHFDAKGVVNEWPMKS